MSTNPIDLTTLDKLKSWAGITSTSQDVLLQDIITALSAYILKLTNRGPADGSIPTSSPFNTPVVYDEIYDGNGNDTLRLNNWPITAVSSVNNAGRIIAASSGIGNPGYAVDQSKKFLILRNGFYGYSRGGGMGAGPCWILGTQNVQIGYTAGFTSVPFDLEMAARKICALNYKRTGWIGQRSQMMSAGAGTVSYNTFEMDDEDRRVISYYMQRAA